MRRKFRGRTRLLTYILNDISTTFDINREFARFPNFCRSTTHKSRRRNYGPVATKRKYPGAREYGVFSVGWINVP